MISPAQSIILAICCKWISTIVDDVGHQYNLAIHIIHRGKDRPSKPEVTVHDSDDGECAHTTSIVWLHFWSNLILEILAISYGSFFEGVEKPDFRA